MDSMASTLPIRFLFFPSCVTFRAMLQYLKMSFLGLTGSFPGRYLDAQCLFWRHQEIYSRGKQEFHFFWLKKKTRVSGPSLCAVYLLTFHAHPPMSPSAVSSSPSETLSSCFSDSLAGLDEVSSPESFSSIQFLCCPQCIEFPSLIR